MKPASVDRRLWILLALALALRLVAVASISINLQTLPDQAEYLQLGRNLLAGRGLVMRDARLDADVRAFRTPGYPIFIAACGGSSAAVRVAQAVLDTASVLAIYFLARRWLDAPASLIAAALVAINPFLIYFSTLILSETLFIALLAWGMVLLVRTRRAWPGLLLLALSVLVRPSAIALPMLLALLTPSPRTRGEGRGEGRIAESTATESVRDTLRRPPLTPTLPPTASTRLPPITGRGGMALVLTLLVLFPWALRNHLVLGDWVWTTTNSGFTLHDGFNPSARGGSDQRFVTELSDQLRPMDEVQRSKFLADRAAQWIRENPSRAAQLTFLKLARFWSPLPLSTASRDAVIVALLYTLPLFILVTIGLLRSSILPGPAKLLLMGPAIYFTMVHALSVGSLRYRLPADVLMSVVAASVFSPRQTQQRAANEL